MARRGALLLCACASLALATSPAVSVAPPATPPAIVDPVRIQDNGNPRGNHSGPRIVAPTGVPSGPTVSLPPAGERIINQGAFDIAVSPAAQGAGSLVPRMGGPSAGDAAQTLLSNSPAAQANQVRSDKGAIILTSGQGAAADAQRSRGKSPPPDTGAAPDTSAPAGQDPPPETGPPADTGPPPDAGPPDTGAQPDAGPLADPGTGNGNGPPSDPGAQPDAGPPTDPGNGNGNGPPSDPGAGDGNGIGPPDGVPPADPCATGGGNPCGGNNGNDGDQGNACLLYTSPSPRDISGSRMPSSA